MTARDTVAIIGSGSMGQGIAACSALAGHRTKLFGRSMEKASLGLDRARQSIRQLLDNGIVGENQAHAADRLLVPCVDYGNDLEDAFWVVESIAENLSAKRELFKALDAILPPQVIITSNTSGLRITEIAQDTMHPARTATTHFWFPAHLVPLVEVVMGEKTDEKLALHVKDLLLKWGKAPVIVKKDLPGQLGNRILQAVIREAIDIVRIGLASPEDVDTAVKMGMGIRMPVWGPLEHIDAVGLDLALSVQKSVLPGICNSTEPSSYLRDLVEAGKLGHKAGAGFYDWKAKDMDALTEKRDKFIMQTLKTTRPRVPSD
jgi:3-hydroxybutyryl-CoA dehydrogenase